MPSFEARLACQLPERIQHAVTFEWSDYPALYAGGLDSLFPLGDRFVLLAVLLDAKCFNNPFQFDDPGYQLRRRIEPSAFSV
jgi:hypothetical protein